MQPNMPEMSDEFWTSSDTFRVIDLSIMEEPLGDLYTTPQAVERMSLQHLFFPDADVDKYDTLPRRGNFDLAPLIERYQPRVLKFLLLGDSDSYTDWHIDMSGSSVIYVLLFGVKDFYIVEPTPDALTAFRKWDRMNADVR